MATGNREAEASPIISRQTDRQQDINIFRESSDDDEAKREEGEGLSEGGDGDG